MAERGILFSGEMVRALLDGRKTQTRRIVKWPVLSASDGGKRRLFVERDAPEICALLAERQRHPLRRIVVPYGNVGDTLWVREAHAIASLGVVLYRANAVRDDSGARDGWWCGDTFVVRDAVRWRSSIHMPRWASRLTLTLTDVRLQRVQDISDQDAHAEGVEPVALNAWGSSYFGGFGKLWDSLNATRGFGWDANPFCWALTFTVERTDA